MSHNDNSGPAFPMASGWVREDGNDPTCKIFTAKERATGITVRDYFAAKAMAGLQANVAANTNDKKAAERAYAIADAMLEARK